MSLAKLQLQDSRGTFPLVSGMDADGTAPGHGEDLDELEHDDDTAADVTVVAEDARHRHHHGTQPFKLVQVHTGRRKPNFYERMTWGHQHSGSGITDGTT